LGADDVILTRDPDDRKQHANRFDFILNTVAFAHDLEAYLRLLRLDGTMCLVGAPEHPHPGISGFTLIGKRRSLAGSLVGGIRQTQEMLDFCAKHKIVAGVEVIRMDQINDAYERMLRSDVKYRFVVDMATL
jgi:uncharacterized zinc-type alcohol dehydrogenase-like protein